MIKPPSRYDESKLVGFMNACFILNGVLKVFLNLVIKLDCSLKVSHKKKALIIMKFFHLLLDTLLFVFCYPWLFNLIWN